jgi:hypothetical protein
VLHLDILEKKIPTDKDFFPSNTTTTSLLHSKIVVTKSVSTP